MSTTDKISLVSLFVSVFNFLLIAILFAIDIHIRKGETKKQMKYDWYKELVSNMCKKNTDDYIEGVKLLVRENYNKDYSNFNQIELQTEAALLISGCKKIYENFQHDFIDIVRIVDNDLATNLAKIVDETEDVTTNYVNYFIHKFSKNVTTYEDLDRQLYEYRNILLKQIYEYNSKFISSTR